MYDLQWVGLKVEWSNTEKMKKIQCGHDFWVILSLPTIRSWLQLIKVSVLLKEVKWNIFAIFTEVFWQLRCETKLVQQSSVKQYR